MNSLIWIVLDSCRYDSMVAAAKPRIDEFAAWNQVAIERRYSYASWTAPSHYAFLMGLVPHRSPSGTFAAEVYKQDMALWSWRLGVEVDYQRFVPHLSLPRVLRELGYRTIARVSLPVLNEATALAAHFDDYRLMESHNDFAGMIREIEFTGAPRFYLLNLGETHYPYMLDDPTLPRVSGLHGAVKWLHHRGAGEGGMGGFFDEQIMQRLRAQQVRCVEHVDALLPELFARCPAGTHLILTADHGELFGEEGFFGHGPIMHPKVFEVPFVEGRVPLN